MKGEKYMVEFKKKPFGWTNKAIYEVEEIITTKDNIKIRFKGYNLFFDVDDLIIKAI